MTVKRVPPGTWAGAVRLAGRGLPTSGGAATSSDEPAAAFNALAKAPDADAVFSKSYQIQKRGIPFIFMREKVTFRGKAFKIKSDK